MPFPELFPYPFFEPSTNRFPSRFPKPFAARIERAKEGVKQGPRAIGEGILRH